MINVAPLIVSLIWALIIVRCFYLGSAGAGENNFRREENPLLFWAIMLAAIAMDLFLFILSFDDRIGKLALDMVRGPH